MSSSGTLTYTDDGFKIIIDNGSTKEIRDLTPEEIELYFEDVSETVSFSNEYKSWTSWHSYHPDIMLNSRNKVFSFKSDGAYLHNQEGYAKFYEGEIHPSYIDMVFNQSPGQTKLYQSLQWISEISDNDKVLYEKTISKVLVFNAYQCSDYIEVIPFTNSRHVEGTWSFNAFRDLVKDRTLPFMDDYEPIEENIDHNKAWHAKKRMSDKYIVVRFLYDNLDQNALYLYDLTATALQSYR